MTDASDKPSTPTDRSRVEFTIEPFIPAAPGPHVTASIEAAEVLADRVEVGPFGTTVTGPRSSMADIARAVVDAALSNGASRVSLQVSIDETSEESP